MKVKTPKKPSVLQQTGIHGNKMNSIMAKSGMPKKPAPMSKNMKVARPRSY